MKVKDFALTSSKQTEMDGLIRNALIMADRELRDVDMHPLAWDIVPYDGLRTVPPADISAITQANPGVLTAENSDSAIAGHGFPVHATLGSIVWIDGVDGMEELNRRLFLLQYVSADTFTLKTLDGLSAVDTSSFESYSSGGAVYHAGLVLNTTAMLTGVTGWTLKALVPSPAFDGYQAEKISEAEAADLCLFDGGWSRPRFWRYWQNWSDPSSVQHCLFWYPFAGDEYAVSVRYQKDVDDFSAWTSTEYPMHPPQVHEYLWHGALANLVGAHERAKRQASDEKQFGQIEVLFAEHWLRQWERDKVETINLSRRMLGTQGGRGGIRA